MRLWRIVLPPILCWMKPRPEMRSVFGFICVGLKRELLAYAEEDESAGDRNLEREKKMIENILHFSRSYKRKSKK